MNQLISAMSAQSKPSDNRWYPQPPISYGGLHIRRGAKLPPVRILMLTDRIRGKSWVVANKGRAVRIHVGGPPKLGYPPHQILSRNIKSRAQKRNSTKIKNPDCQQRNPGQDFWCPVSHTCGKVKAALQGLNKIADLNQLSSFRSQVQSSPQVSYDEGGK